MKRLLSFAGVCAMTLVWSGQAQAFCRTASCDSDDDDFRCSIDHGCLVNEQPLLYWPQSCISFAVQKDGSPLSGIDYETAHAVVVNAFETWLAADCVDGTHPNVKIYDYGAIACGEREYNTNDGNANAVMFRDDHWPYENAIDTLGLTTITYNTKNGQIYDADIELNSHDTELTMDLKNAVSDLPSIVTHEVGHFLGLAHSAVPGATMRANYIQGDTSLRNLDADDVAGICAVYPADLDPEISSCKPRHGFSSQCSSPEDGCTYAASGAAHSKGALVAFGLGAMLWFGRRRR